MKTRKIIMLQVLMLLVIAMALFLLYPRAEVSVSGNVVRFSGNADIIVISENPDFTNPRFIDLSEFNEVVLNLKPGIYYWKPDNGIIEGFSDSFVIDSEVGLLINRTDNETDLVNVGNVKIKIEKSEGGVTVGRIILEPEQSEIIEDSGIYKGGQDG